MRSYKVLIVLLSLTLAVSNSLFALEVPYLAGRVNDTANILSPETETNLEALLKKHEEETSNQIVVLTIPSLEGEVLEEYSIKVAETWKLGQKKKDNGVLLLIAKDDRKLRIEVGYGLEGDLTDVTCSHIIKDEIVPKFKSGDFDGGVTAGVDAIIGVIQHTYTPSADDASTSGEGETPPLMVRLLFGVAFFSIVGIFTFMGMFSKLGMKIFLFLFLIPFWAAFPYVIFGYPGNLIALGTYLVMYWALPLLLKLTPWKTKIDGINTWVQSSSGGSGGSSSSGGFSGGGGSFGGGGSSGSW